MRGVAWVWVLVVLCGCGRSDAKTKIVHHDSAGPTGSIRGKVVLIGTVPKSRQLDNHICGPQAQPIFDVKGLGSDSPPPAEQPVIDQKDCQYVPHLLAIRSGQQVVFKSSESAGMPHNVHIAALGKNLAIVGPGTLPPVKFDTVDFINVRCDVHPWMSCWVAVMDGPWFAVSSPQGTFEIKDVPAGPCTLAVWHERLSTMEQTLNVTANQTTEVTFTYRAE